MVYGTITISFGLCKKGSDVVMKNNETKQRLNGLKEKLLAH